MVGEGDAQRRAAARGQRRAGSGPAGSMQSSRQRQAGSDAGGAMHGEAMHGMYVSECAADAIVTTETQDMRGAPAIDKPVTLGPASQLHSVSRSN